MELREDNDVLDDGAERAEQPWERAEKVILLLGVGDETGAIGGVASQGKQEEEQGEPLARLFAPVLDDLRDSSPERKKSASWLATASTRTRLRIATHRR